MLFNRDEAVAPSHEGAWIEIPHYEGATYEGVVAPSHEGAWIEIVPRGRT